MSFAFFCLLICLVVLGLWLAGLVYGLWLRWRGLRIELRHVREREVLRQALVHELRTHLTLLGLSHEKIQSSDLSHSQNTAVHSNPSDGPENDPTHEHKGSTQPPASDAKPPLTPDLDAELRHRQELQAQGLMDRLQALGSVRHMDEAKRYRRGNVVAFVHMVFQGFMPVAEARGVDLNYVPRRTHILMDFVPEALRRTIAALVDSAIHNTQVGGTLTLSVDLHRGRLTFVFSGTRIPLTREEFFALFVLPTGSIDPQELLLKVDLIIARQLVEQRGGKFLPRVDSQHGLSCRVSLPRRYFGFLARILPRFVLRLFFPIGSPEPASESISQAEALGLTSSNTLSNASPNASPNAGPAADPAPDVPGLSSLLVVEDDPDMAQYVGSVLSPYYNVRYAGNGSIALDRIREHLPDLVLVDLVMPFVDGPEFCRRLRALSLPAYIPVIMLSAHYAEDERARSIEAGADMCLPKAFDTRELLTTVRHLLELRHGLQNYNRQALMQEARQNPLSMRDQSFLNQVVDLCYRLMAKGDVDANLIAQELGLSRYQLNKRIQALTGESTVAYLTRIRLSKAKKMLDHPQDYPVGEVAARCGFEDVAYFSRVFKQAFALTPSQYRRRVK